jgi:hypothetical protein
MTMKPLDSHDYDKKEMVKEAFARLTPPLLILVGTLLIFDWLHTHVAPVLIPFVNSLFSRLM